MYIFAKLAEFSATEPLQQDWLVTPSVAVILVVHVII